MPAAPHDLTFEECEEWMRELGYISDNKKLDWTRFLHDADVETDQYNLKKRWREGGAPEVRLKIRATLERVELKRKERTTIGARLFELEEWNQLGRAIMKNPVVFEVQLETMRRVATQVENLERANAMRAEAEAALGTMTATPKKQRK
jgi:hypothetical protein